MTIKPKLVTVGSGFEPGKADAILLQTSDGIYEKYEHTLALLGKEFLIERVENKNGETEFWLLEPLPKIIKELREMKNTNRIEFPDSEKCIEGFIKKHLRSKGARNIFCVKRKIHNWTLSP